MANITAADVNKLRSITGAGMMDCKKALVEADGDFEKAIDDLRKKGQKVAANRSDRDAAEGVVLAKTSQNDKKGVLLVVNCETDFVAKNEQFTELAQQLITIALDKNPASIEEFKTLTFNGNLTVNDKLVEMMGKIGEKIDLSKYESIVSEKVVAYNHPGNRLATIVGFTQSGAAVEPVAKQVAMQIAAMAPIAIDKNDVDANTIEREIEIGKEQARQEGKPEEMLEKIALGKLNKFYKESTLLNQELITDNKKTVGQYLQEVDKSLTVTAFKRISLN